MSAPSPSGAEDHDSRSTALMLAEQGYKIVPLPPREKFPKGLAEWQKRATNDVAQIKRWFDKHPERGVGWAMGAQPNGLNLAGIDVDVAGGKLGFSTMSSLRDRFGLREMMRSTIRTETGTGGWHMIVDTGSVLVSNGRLGPGVDLRGEGGFLVAPPSIHPNGRAYRWVEGKAPWDVPPFRIWQSFAEWLAHPEAGDSAQALLAKPLERNTAVKHGDVTPGDWAREHLRIPDLLVEGGWQYRETKGMDTYWTRPDKSIRDGHSAVLHDAAPLVVWSTSAPGAFWRAGKDARDGSRVLSPLEVFAAVRCNGDVQSAAREIRKLMPDRPRDAVITPSNAVIGPEPSQGALTPAPAVSNLNLPEEFWCARPVLAHIRDAAYSNLISPDAVLLNVLARFSALVPPSVRIPRIVGAAATFDFIGCVVGSSAAGKSAAFGVAEELLPINRKDILIRAAGSGEGLIQAFLKRETDPETGKEIRGGAWVPGDVQAVLLVADEGTILAEMMKRNGTTILQTLCSAWSGQMLGQLNAAESTNRYLPAKRGRVATVINIQTAKGHELLVDDAIGLPARMTFGHAHDPNLPDADKIPKWPGRLVLPVPPSITGSISYVEYAPEICDEVVERHLAIARKKVEVPVLDQHLGLQRLKLAGLFALMDERKVVNGDDWALAGIVVESSQAVRQLIVDSKVAADRDRLFTQGVAQAYRDQAAEDTKERQKIARLRDTIIAKIPPEGIARNALRKMVCSSETKHRFEPALEAAVRDGKVVVQDDGLIRLAS